MGFNSKSYGAPPGSGPALMAVGPDNNSVWVTEWGSNKIAKLDLSGTLLAEYSVPQGSKPYGITTGSDGNIYFTENVSPDSSTGLLQSYIGKVTSAGAITMTPAPQLGTTSGITSGPDGNIWFCEFDAPNPAIAQYNVSSGQITQYTVPAGAGDPQFIVTGADGQLWFAGDNPSSAIVSFHP